MLIAKIVLLIICALLLVMCYRPQLAAKLFFKESEPTQKRIMEIKLTSLIISVILFICIMILM